MNYAVVAFLLVKDIETRSDEICERKAHAEIMAALDAFDAIVSDILGARPHLCCPRRLNGADLVQKMPRLKNPKNFAVSGPLWLQAPGTRLDGQNAVKTKT